MNVLIAFSRRPEAGRVGESVSRLGEDVVTYPLASYAGWTGSAVVGNPLADTTHVVASAEQFFLVTGRYCGDKHTTRDEPLEDVARRLSGHFLLVRQTPQRSVEICTDPMGSIPLYLYQDGDDIRLSTRLDWLLASVPRAWRVSWRQLFCFVLNSGYAGRRLLVEDVALTGFATRYAFTEAGTFAGTAYWEPPYDGRVPFEENGRAVADALLDTVSRLTAGREKIAVSLTAGLDSRLILAAAITSSHDKVRTATHGFAGSRHEDIVTARKLSELASVPHVFLDSTRRVLDEFHEVDDSGLLWRNLGGQGRHNFVYDAMMFEDFSARGFQLELRGLAGGLFKAKWHKAPPTPHVIARRTQPYQRFFGGEARHALDGLDRFFINQSMEDAPSHLTDREREGWLSYAVRFSNRIAPRTFFQASVFPSVNPFYDRRFLEAYLNIDINDRAGALTHVRTIQRICPRLLELPYLRGGNPYVFRDGSQHAMGRSWPLPAWARRIWAGAGRRLDRFVSWRRPPVPASWEYMKPAFLERLPPVLEEAKTLFPVELGPLNVRHFARVPIFDPRSFRFYSMLEFIVYCNKAGISLR